MTASARPRFRSPLPYVEVSDVSSSPDRIRHATVQSAALGRRADLSVLLPPSGEPAAAVVVLLHGVYGSHWSWLYQGALERHVAELELAAHIPPMAYVMPSDGLWGQGSGYVDVDGNDHEAWIVREAIPVGHAIARAAGVKLFIGGLSMGGYGALRLGATYAALFDGVFALSTVTTLAGLRTFGRTPDVESVIEPHALWARAPAPPPLAFECGRNDRLCPSNIELHERLTDAGVAHDFEIRDGDHSWSYWQAAIRRSLTSLAMWL